jgi:hypothetical protein
MQVNWQLPSITSIYIWPIMGGPNGVLLTGDVAMRSVDYN